MNILFTCAGRRNYLINYFKQAIGNYGQIYTADMQLSAPAMVDAHKSFIVPPIYSESYIDTLIGICINNDVSGIISLNDLELPILSINKRRFEEHNITVIISSEEVIDICFDKYKTYKFALENNIQSPKTFIKLESAKTAITNNDLSFPIILKPRWGSASIGIETVYSIKELELAYNLLTIKLGRTILAEASKKDKDQAILIQELIKGQEFGLDIINDLDGNYCATIVKKKLAMRAGETDKAVTVDDKNLSNYGKIIGESLKHVGNLDCDFFLADGKYYLLELNSRFGGGYPFSHEAGANVPLAIINWLEGKKVDPNFFKVIFNESFSKYDKLMKVPL